MARDEASAGPSVLKPSLLATNLAHRSGLRDIVADVSLSVREGEAVALLGRNGAGKTTTFNMLIGLTRPDRGSILWRGEDVTALSISDRVRRGLNYLPQESTLFRSMTVEQNLLLTLEVCEPDRLRRESLMAGLLGEFHLTALRKMPVATISGGERRRCELARLLAARPSLVLLDEPFAKLDPIAVEQMRTVIRRLRQDGIGVLITDHRVRETLGSVDRAYVIDDGRIIAEGSAQEILAGGQVGGLLLN